MYRFPTIGDRYIRARQAEVHLNCIVKFKKSSVGWARKPARKIQFRCETAYSAEIYLKLKQRLILQSPNLDIIESV